MKPYGYIYLTRNLVNDTVYVGQHAGEWSNRYMGSGFLLLRAMKKYGIGNFRCELLELCQDRVDLDRTERDFIAILKAAGAELYNVLPGGRGCGAGDTHPSFGKKRSKETRRLQSLASLGRKKSQVQIEKMRINSTGKTASVMARARMSESHKALWKNKAHHLKGKKLSADHRQKIGSAQVGRKDSADTIARRVAACQKTKRAKSLLRQAPSISQAETIISGLNTVI